MAHFDLSNVSVRVDEFGESLKAYRKENAQNMDEFFLITMAMIIYFMQAGFAFLEAGAVRSKNTTNILIKNALDSLFGGVSYWLVGYAFAFGSGNEFIGYSHFAHHNMEPGSYAFWFFHYVFAAAAATIVSGAVAERCDFIAYVIYSSIITGFIYPVVTHWAWSPEGWLTNGETYDIDGEKVAIGYVDFAGSGVVHMVGGIAAFAGAAILGPRIGRFDKETGNPVDLKGHSVPLASLGGFILVFGFFAFNGSSQGSIASPGDGTAVAVAVKNTVLAGSGGSFTTLVLNKIPWIGDNKWSFLTTLNGCLTGMVAICAGCNQYETYIAFIIGVFGGVAYMITTWMVLKLKVDDPLDATAVHYGGGICGVLMVPFFSQDFGIVYFGNKRAALHLAWNLLGIVAIAAWTAVLAAAMFFVLKFLNIFRVSFEYELKGLDIPKHGEPAYPAEAYGHGWGEKGDALSILLKASMTPASAATSKDIGQHAQAPSRASENPEVDALRKDNKNGSASTLSLVSTQTTNTQL